MNTKLTFAFREYVPLYFAFTIDYSPNDYIILTKGKDTVCYLFGSLDKITEITRKLSKKEFRKKLISDCVKASAKLSKYKFKSDLSKQSLIELQKEFKIIVKLTLDWLDSYLLTEAKYWEGLEKIISKGEKKQLSHLRFEAKELIVKCFRYIDKKILMPIVNKSKVKYSDISLYTFDELLKLPKKPSTKIISNRKKGWGVIKKGKARKLMTNKELLYYNKLIKQELKLEKKELMGTSVHKGEVIGEVKIVKVSSLKKIKSLDLKNKILVTPMTQPEIVPFLNGCLGIITDEGGMLCHASIVAREFNLPCIVGTKIATKVLKNNQKVKLDANTGKITIL